MVFVFFPYRGIPQDNKIVLIILRNLSKPISYYSTMFLILHSQKVAEDKYKKLFRQYGNANWTNE